MAEESISSPLTPDLKKSAGPAARRHSTGKVNGRGEVLSRYLRASTGSCHDFCKHGRKLAVEDDGARNPMPKRPTAKPRVDRGSSPIIKPQRDEPLLQKKPSALSRKPFLDSGSRATQPSKQGQLSKSLESLPTGKMRISLKEPSKFKSPKEKKVSSLSPPSEGSSVKKTSGSSESRNRKAVVTPKVASRNMSVSPTASLSLTSSVNKSPRNLPTGKHSSLNVMKIHRDTELLEEQSNNEVKESSNHELEENTLHFVTMEKEHHVADSCENDNGDFEVSSPLSAFNSDMDEDCTVELHPIQQLAIKLDTIKVEEVNTNLKPEGTESFMVGSYVLTSSSNESSSVPATPSLSYHSEGAEVEQESEFTESELEHGFLSEEEDEEEEGDEEEEVEGMLSGGQKVLDSDNQPQELHFRRGKVVDIESGCSVPRQLKFRRGRVLGDHENVKSADRRRFRKRDVMDSNINSTNEQKVVLRHRRMQGKKDAQVLLNNVIEETASKLVERGRKSKVKALVGAFETVISLQENKSCSDVATTNDQVS